MDAVGAIVFLPRESGNEPPALFRDLLFSPAAVWLCAELRARGVTRFFAVCHPDDQARAATLFPQGTEFVTAGAQNATASLVRFLADLGGEVIVITRPVFLLPANTTTSRGVPEPSAWSIAASALADALTAGAEFQTALATGGEEVERGGMYPLSCTEGQGGWNWSTAETSVRLLAADRLTAAGVQVIDPSAVYVDPAVTVGRGTVLLPGTILRGQTTIGENCEIGPNTMIQDCTIGNGVTVNASQLNESTVDDGAHIGPFAYVRPHCHVGAGVKVGDFVELKNSNIGSGTKISHLTYVGDTDVGSGVNFGCGTVTVNYDGSNKYRTTIGDNAFIGCNSNLVAPVKIGEGAYTAAGSTITDDVPADSLAIARTPQTIKVQWAAKRRKARGKK